jgi:hypothetical protein
MAMPIPMNTLGTAYTQDFNTLSNTPGTTTNDLTIIGWEMTEGGLGTRDNEQYAVDDGTSNTGDTYSYGTSGSTDRALGSLQSGSLNATFGVAFFNSQAFTVMDSLAITYVGEQWRLGQTGRGPDRLDFQYSIGVSNVPSGTWVDFDALDFSTPNTVAAVGDTDGNGAAFRTSISATITGVNFGPQMFLFLRWVDADIAGPEDGLAIDDFSITPSSTINVNQPPMNSVPSAQMVEADTATAINGLAIADPDAGSSVMTTTLSVEHGALTFAANGGAIIQNNGSAGVTLQGTLNQINAALTTPDNLTYRGSHGFSGADILTIKTIDNPPLDLAGSQSDTDQVTITVKQPLTGTNGDDAFTAQPGSQRIDALGGNDTITFDFRLVDATVTYDGNKVIIDGPSSHTVLTGFEKFVFTDGTVDNNDGNWLVDDLFYFSRNHDVWNAHAEADRHYDQSGWHEGRDPNAFFSTAIYLSANPDVQAAGVNPLAHFDQSGWKEGRIPSLDFDPREYLANYLDVAAAKVDPLMHFLQIGAGEGRLTFAPPSELITASGFDYAYYLQHNPDVAAAHIDPFQHFQTVGWQQGRNPNALFDVNGYLATYADVAAADVNPLDHYHAFGWKEGRDPSVNFDTTSYLAAYADVAAAHADPLAHFLQFGHHEGRSAFADGAWG